MVCELAYRTFATVCAPKGCRRSKMQSRKSYVNILSFSFLNCDQMWISSRGMDSLVEGPWCSKPEQCNRIHVFVFSSTHNLRQIIDGGDCGLSVCNAAYLLSAGSVSIPLLIQILNPLVSSWCHHTTNAVLRMVVIPSSPSLNEQCENKWVFSKWEPRSCRLMWDYLFCKTSSVSFYVIHCWAKWAGSTRNDEAEYWRFLL